MLERLKKEALNGNPATVDDALKLNESYSADMLADAADEIRIRWCGDVIDTCSIVNARSGRCSEDCKWCAQSRFHNTGIEEYDFVPENEAMRAAMLNETHGIK